MASFSRRAHRDYERSNDVLELTIAPATDAVEAASRLAGGLVANDRIAVEVASQAIVSSLCRSLGVRDLPVKVGYKRLVRGRVQFYGFCGKDGYMTLYFRTGKTNKPVAHKTYLRTLVHELTHHLDWVHLRLLHSFHTKGFYGRVRSLYQGLLDPLP
ncbi:MAG: hypothetical protein AAB434_02955 [Planctomycetota bacterium]